MAGGTLDTRFAIRCWPSLALAALLLALALAVVAHHAELLEHPGAAHADSTCKAPAAGDGPSASAPADSPCEWPLPAPAAHADHVTTATVATADARAGPARLQVFLT